MKKKSIKISNRVVACLIDYTLFFILMIIVGELFGEPNEDGGRSIKGWAGLIVPTLWIIYFPGMEARNGQTLGKMIMGLRVVTKSLSDIGFIDAFKRRLLDPIDFLSAFGLVAYIAVKNTPDHQRLGDLVAKTIVIGDEVVVCKHCLASLKLTPNEIIGRSFTCPQCQTINDLASA